MSETNNASTVDLLVFGAHPDDAELFCGGTIAKLARRGRRVVLADLTRGEKGTRGSAAERRAEAERATEILRVERRALDCGDTLLDNNETNRLALVELIRELRPAVVFGHEPNDRHPDHRKAHALVRDACFYAGVGGIVTPSPRYRPRGVFYFFGNVKGPSVTPDIVIDVTETFAVKTEALQAYASQFHNPEYEGEETYIAGENFWETIEARARLFGSQIDVKYGEAFICDSPLPVDDPVTQIHCGHQP